MYITLNRASRTRGLPQSLNGAAAFDRLFDGFALPAPARAATSVEARFDVVEKDDRFEARIEIPGVDKSAIDVQVDGAIVRVRAERKTEDAVEGVKLLHSNRVVQSWLRNFTLPTEVDEARVEAAYVDGVLTLTLPKKEVPQPKRIEIK